MTQPREVQVPVESIANSREYDSLSKEVENHELLKKIAQRMGLTPGGHSRQERGNSRLSRRTSIRNETSSKKRNFPQSFDPHPGRRRNFSPPVRFAHQIDARTMSAYERSAQRAQSPRFVVSVFNNDSCGGCFNTIIPSEDSLKSLQQKSYLRALRKEHIVSNTIEAGRPDSSMAEAKSPGRRRTKSHIDNLE